eukprot:739259_1
MFSRMAPDMEIVEKICTQPLESIRKVTTNLRIHGEDLMIRSFIDEGASITIGGTGIGQILRKYIESDVKSSIKAGGFDAKKSGKYYVSNIRLKVPIIDDEFSYSLGKRYPVRRYIRIWIMTCIPSDLLILGRDAKKILDLGTFSRSDLSQMCYHMARKTLFNTVPNSESMDAYLDRIEYKNRGNPGLYRITPNNVVKKLDTVFAFKSPLSARCDESLDRGVNEAKDLIVELNTTIDIAVIEMKEEVINGNRYRYPRVLDELHYGQSFSKEEQLKHMTERMAQRAHVFARTDFDVGLVDQTKYPAVHIHVKNPNDCGLADGIEGIDETLQNEREEIMQELERKNDEDGEAKR